MKFILKGRTPIPCNDDDLWEAWFINNNPIIDEFENDIVEVTAEFTGKPLKLSEEDLSNVKGPLVFKVVAVFKDLKKPAQFAFYDSWEDAEKKFQEHLNAEMKTLQ